MNAAKQSKTGGPPAKLKRVVWALDSKLQRHMYSRRVVMPPKQYSKTVSASDAGSDTGGTEIEDTDNGSRERHNPVCGGGGVFVVSA